MSSEKVIECVPNISEGRNEEVIHKLIDILDLQKGVQLLHIDSGYDANRTVFTIVGNPEMLIKGMLSFYKVVLESIDMRIHTGAHPCIGAVDVCPFIPLKNISLKEVIPIAEEFGKTVAEKLKIPVYLYESAAQRPERIALSNIRKGGFWYLEEKMKHKDWKPDFGPELPHFSFGASCIGAREILIAFNISLHTNDVKIAQKIASQIRTSSKNKQHAFSNLKAIGWEMPSYNCVQVSMNLTNYKKTTIFDVFETVKYLSAAYGVDIIGSEIVGMLPLDAIKSCGTSILKKEGIKKMASDEELIDITVKYLGLNAHEDFIPKEKILDFNLDF
ncbi:MAG: glutamate formimidoyltransferase [Chitinophagaceae bacterium]|nr:MAG: glutamate formimidoyltransferase [Chitinophagaceae bacterium]